jgi:hypothetical protein
MTATVVTRAEPVLRPRGDTAAGDSVRTHRLGLALGAGCAVLYALLGVWTITRGQYMIGDAAYRVANARVILFSRDPHLAAIGMTWMPLSTLATLPFTAVLEPFGLGWAAGSLMTATFGGATVVMLVRLARQVDASTTTTVVVVSVYALNPVIVFWTGSAMMEIPTLFFMTWACTAWIRWLDDRRVFNLAAVGIALGFGTLTRYEQLLVTVCFCALVLLAERRGRRFASAVIVTLPSIVVMVTWCAVNYLIRGDPFLFLRSSASAGGECAAANSPLPVSLRDPAAGITDWCDIDLSLGDALMYSFERVIRFAPVLCVLGPLMLVRDLRSRLRCSPVLAIIASTLVTPLLIAWFLTHDKGTGNPRYFLTAALAAPMLCLVVAGWRGRARIAWISVAVVLLAVGAVTSIHMELDQRYAGMENEQLAISNLVGLKPVMLGDGGTESPEQVDDWRAAAAEIDRLTDDDDLIALDSSTSFTILLFSRHLDRFAIPEDRDFEQLLSLTETKFTVVLVTGSTKSATGIDARLSDIVKAGSGTQRFEQVADLEGVGQLYRRVDA